MVRFHLSKSTVAAPLHTRDTGYGTWGEGQSSGNGPHWGNDHNGYQSHHQPPIHDPNGFVYTTMQEQPPMYVASNMPPPRTTYPQLQPHIAGPQLPLGYPSEYRPSQLRSQSLDQNQFLPPYSMTTQIASAPSPARAPPPRGSGRTGSNPRKTLTDVDRRNMCIYAQTHPSEKQTEIGALFGVERSTVSKVLRYKDKYMQQDDGSRSPARKPKNKGQDPERTLVNWVKKHHRRGDALSDETLKKKLIYFANAAQNPDAHSKANNPVWVKKFKREHNLHGLKSRKNSVADESEEPSAPPSGAQTPNSNSHPSPCSPPPVSTKEESPSAMSIIKDEDGMKSESPQFESEFSFSPKPYHSMSNASLASTFNERGPFSPGPSSPGSGLFGQHPSSPFNQERSLSSGPGNYSRPRSQTFPMVDTGSYMSPATLEPLTTKYITGTALDHSPLGDMSSALGGVEELSEPDTHHLPTPMVSNSPLGLALGGISHMPPHLSMSHNLHHHSGTPTPVSGIQPSGAYSLEHAFEILRIAMMEQGNGAFDPQDYMTLGKIMKQLNVHTNQLGGDIGFHRVESADFHQYMKQE
ncbi:CenpB-DNA-bind-domain-containing protein [Venturia nashicola]|uniref:CenpB-DNA-bind-domain-containing protein n=1 Tax=Venturia nashicola TaxID=86259 RepID=A0A4Z1P4T1_9PEZI|nr:CenpB-DNA-bind-domain-containing protein [Venturia nashicola]TLD36509.1 CenpB-DNA-bind-domain-containing protein [Venturia nashicola]